MYSFKTILALGAALLTGTATLAQAQDLAETHLRVLGSASNSNIHTALELPFWTEVLPANSGGKVTAEMVSISESGLKGPELLRLLSTGALDVAYGDFGMVSGDDPHFEGLDLAGVLTDMDMLHEATMAYKPVLRDVLANQGIRLMGLLPFPGQAFFCSTPVTSIDDLEGKKVRTYTRSSSEFIEAIGAVPVSIPFPDVIPALQTGVADCGVTGTFSGNTARWFEVTNSLYLLPMGSGISFYAISTPAWEAMDPAVQDYITTEFDAFEERVWELTKLQTQEGINCNTGVGECTRGTPSTMTLYEPSEEDVARAHQVAHDVVLPSWAERCGEACVARWNETVGAVAGVQAQ